MATEIDTVRALAAAHQHRPGGLLPALHAIQDTFGHDWATNCPEYRVTAVQVMTTLQPSSWQKEHSRFHDIQQTLFEIGGQTVESVAAK